MASSDIPGLGFVTCTTSDLKLENNGKDYLRYTVYNGKDYLRNIVSLCTE
jgi:hypothetical protein